MKFIPHVSELDQSVNFEHRLTEDPGMLEARYVRRVDDYFIIYLSSQTGCNQACRMCWLTATGQTKHRDVTVEEYLQQAGEVMQYYAKECQNGKPEVKKVHFNFMARGEPLANKIFLENADEVLQRLADMAKSHGLEYKFLISTIFPKSFVDTELTDVFKNPALYPELYYSLYSTEVAFRRKWLPKAMNCATAMGKLKRWAIATSKVPKIHYAFIEGENDDIHEVNRIAQWVANYDFPINWNVVRYNPPVGHYSKEPPESNIKHLADIIRYNLPNSRVKVIPRVGTDVQASCGTFLK